MILFIRCCTYCVFDNFLFRRQKSQTQIRRKKSFFSKNLSLAGVKLEFHWFIVLLPRHRWIPCWAQFRLEDWGLHFSHNGEYDSYLPLFCDQWWFWCQYPRMKVWQVTSTVGGWDSQIIKKRCCFTLCEYKSDRAPEQRMKWFWWWPDVCQQGNMALAALRRGRNSFDQRHLGSWMVRNIVNTTKYYQNYDQIWREKTLASEGWVKSLLTALATQCACYEIHQKYIKSFCSL